MRPVVDTATGNGWTMIRGDVRKCGQLALAESSRRDRTVAVHVITDPPYAPNVHTQSRRAARAGSGKVSEKHEIAFSPMTPALMRASASVFRALATGWVLVFSCDEGGYAWRRALERAELRWVRRCYWVKLGAAPQFTGDRPAAGVEIIAAAHAPDVRLRWNGGGQAGVWSHAIETNRGGNAPRLHPTQKPVDLMIRLAELFTDRGDVVVDPFAGSATTGAACLRTGRRFVGVEKDRAFFDVACERLAAEERGHDVHAERAGMARQLVIGEAARHG